MLQSTDYEIVKITLQDRPRIEEFIRKFYFKHEPTTIAVGREDNPSPLDLKYTVDFLKEGTSLMAVSRAEDGGQILLGVCINGDFSKLMSDLRHSKLDTCECPAFNTILRYLSYVEDRANIWQVTGEDRALGVQAVAVAPEARRRGIAQALMERTREFARELGYRLLRVDCSSHYTALIVQKMGMVCAYTLPFAEYTDENGVPFLSPPSPHLDTKIYVQKLDPIIVP